MKPFNLISVLCLSFCNNVLSQDIAENQSPDKSCNQCKSCNQSPKSTVKKNIPLIDNISLFKKDNQNSNTHNAIFSLFLEEYTKGDLFSHISNPNFNKNFNNQSIDFNNQKFNNQNLEFNNQDLLKVNSLNSTSKKIKKRSKEDKLKELLEECDQNIIPKGIKRARVNNNKNYIVSDEEYNKKKTNAGHSKNKSLVNASERFEEAICLYINSNKNISFDKIKKSLEKITTKKELKVLANKNELLITGKEDVMCPAIFAATRGKLELLKALCEVGADVNNLDNLGANTILSFLKTAQYSEENIRFDIFDFLLPKSKFVYDNEGENIFIALADMLQKNIYEESDSAEETKRKERNYKVISDSIIKALDFVKDTSILNHQDNNGYTALTAALNFGAPLSAIEALLKKGASPNIATKEKGYTAPFFIGNYPEEDAIKLIELLKANGCNFNCKDKENKNLLYHAFQDFGPESNTYNRMLNSMALSTLVPVRRIL